MRLVPDRCFELDGVNAQVAWNLVDRVFQQTAGIVVGIVVFSVLGISCAVTTGSLWYLGGSATAMATGAWRLAIIRQYKRSRAGASAIDWARRSLWAASAAACCWGAWGAALLYEPRYHLCVLIVCVLGATVLFSAVRHATLRIIAIVQAVLTVLPLFIVLMFTGDWSYRLYGLFIIPFVGNVLAYNGVLHRQMLRLFQQDQEKADLLRRLEAANQELEVINRHLETLVATDSLTGVANRRAFDLASAREWLRASRESMPVSLLLLDIDHFKAFNDFYGHQAGDACLRSVAAAAASAIRRPGDTLARYGGEEFTVILPGSRLDGAVRVAEQILAAIGEKAIPHDASPFGYVTASIGAACLTPSPDSTVESLIARADAALYAAKRGGRNRLHAADCDAPGCLQAEPAPAALAVLVTAPGGR